MDVWRAEILFLVSNKRVMSIGICAGLTSVPTASLAGLWECKELADRQEESLWDPSLERGTLWLL